MNMLKLFKGQSAIEYLTTYGWMLLVVAIVGGAIFTTVQNSSQIQSTSGLANADVQIEEFGVTGNGLETELRAASADQVENVNISLVDQSTGETVYSNQKATMPVGDTETVTFSDVGSSENTNTYDVEITYDTGGLEDLTAEGTITGRISINGTVPEEGNDNSVDDVSAGDDTNNEANGPTASFSSDPPDVHPGESFSVDASGSTDNGSISSYSWDWTNDGENEASDVTNTHSYGSTGTYTVNLTVTDDQNNKDSATADINVTSNTAPSASFSTNFTDNLSTGETFQIDASGSSDPDGNIENYQWDWTNDDTADTSGETATHSYSSTGTYTIELTTKDDDGTTNTNKTQIEVKSESSSNQVTASDSLELYWPMNETSGTTAVDYSGNNRDGSISGATVGDSGINGDKAYTFSGGDQVTATSPKTDSWEMFFVVEAGDLGSSSPYYRTLISHGNHPFTVYDVSSDNWRSDGKDGNPNRVQVPESQPDTEGSWRIISQSHDSGSSRNIRIYNATGSKILSDSAGSASVNYESSTLYLGSWDDGSRGWVGMMSEFRWYDAPLTSSERQDVVEDITS